MGQQRNNSGTLGKARERKSEKSPEYRGSAMVDGRHYWVSAWVKTGSDGSKFFSLAFTLKDERPQQPKDYPAQQPQQAEADFDDDIPF